MSVVSTTASVPTLSGGRYLQQLCKHWAHSLIVESSKTDARIVFPKDLRGQIYESDAVADFAASDAGLDIRIEAGCPEKLELLKMVVSTHIDRFAFREAPLPFHWT